jgi:hypothetical protein
VRGNGSGLWHLWQTGRGGAWAKTWLSHGSAGGSPAVALNGAGRLEVFVRGNDGALYHLWQTQRGGAWTKSWRSHGSAGGGFASAPALALNGDGRLELFVRGRDGALWHIWQIVRGGAWTESWLSHGSAGGGFADFPPDD